MYYCVYCRTPFDVPDNAVPEVPVCGTCRHELLKEKNLNRAS